jgi:hypothetical protein
MRKFILLCGPNKNPLSPYGMKPNGILFTKEEAEDRLNSIISEVAIEVLEISDKPVAIVTNKRSIV